MSPPLPPSTKVFENTQYLMDNINVSNPDLQNQTQNLLENPGSVNEIIRDEHRLIQAVEALKSVGINGINKRNKEFIIVFFLFFFK
jgi:hypothetical protein